jgi:hypothetical protein
MTNRLCRNKFINGNHKLTQKAMHQKDGNNGGRTKKMETAAGKRTGKKSGCH